MRTKNLFLLPALIIGLGLIPVGRVTAQTFKTLHSFTAASGAIHIGTNSDGAFPTGGVILSGNTLYGTASFGGASGYGTVYAVNTDGTGFTNLRSFADSFSDGYTPYAGLLSSGNNLYGTTLLGGNPGWGTVFAINTDGTGFTILHSFTAGFGSPTVTNSDGAVPYGYGGLILLGNTLYGTANIGGGSGYGTVFKVNTDGTGFTNLHSFTAGSGAYPAVTNSDGANPLAGLILSGNTLYGTARTGGSSGAGTVFAINTNGTCFATLHSFTGGDGAGPAAGLLLSGSTLYGTASGGGSSSNGTVFKVNTDGTGFTNLHSFTAGSGSSAIVTNSDGADPRARLIVLGNTLYGTASGGGSSGNGTVFAVNTDGTGFTTLHSFTAGSGSYPTVTNSDGANPVAGLILSGNTLYGTTRSGGSSGLGTVFSLSLPPPQRTVHYVDVNNANPSASPYTSWATAATTIQDAIDASEAGDEIVVTNGIYATGERVGNRVAIDKTLTVRSVNGPLLTIIDGWGSVRCVYLTSGASLSGFTLTNGFAETGGGAYGGTLNNCTLTGNWAATEGMGVNSSGGGAYGSTLNNCTLSGNLAAYGGGAALCTLNNCTLTGNSAGSPFTVSGGVYGCSLNNCIVYFNTQWQEFGPPRVGNYDSCTLNYSCTTPQPTNGIGNITSAPLFVDQASGNLRLQSNSPCINAGNNTYAVGVTDLEGNPRIVGGSVDMGAYEFQSPASIAPQLTITSSGTHVILAWPTNYAEVVIQEDRYEAYFLHSTTNLVSPVVWRFVYPTPVVRNGQLVVTNTIDGNQRFYRLVKGSGPLSDVPCLRGGPKPCPCYECVEGVWTQFGNCRFCD